MPKIKKVEEIYQKKTPLEHILLRPDTYIGSTTVDKQQMWVWDENTKKIVRKIISFCPGLYKIFDEIIVNAADNKFRDPSMSTIRVDIDPITNSIVVFNDGKGIPVTIHKDENMYVPTMIFGHLLTSSNFDDNERKIIGGRNGFGAKLCNIFSHKFVLETASREHSKKFVQTWESNMSVASEPQITAFTGSDYTRVTFVPDLARFNMQELDPDFVSLLKRRAYDISGTTHGVKVYLNGELIKSKSFLDYAKLYSLDEENSPDSGVLYKKVSDYWELCVLPSDGSFHQISFVNSVATTKGGTHVNHVVNKITDRLVTDVASKLKNESLGKNVRPQYIKQHLWLFINSKIENPSFDSQTKENMTLNERSFGSSCTIDAKFLGEISKSVTDNIVSWYKLKLKSELNKKGASHKKSKVYGIDKLEEANKAGTSDSMKCTLILTEGDSAKSLAISGMDIVGRDHYGAYPLRGKVLNIRETSTSAMIKNKEIEELVKIIGLDFKKKYEDDKELHTLRYGKVMLMTDQDFDGSHIKGLLINFFHYLWPGLVKQNFLEQFITPIVKAKKGSTEHSFYSIPEYEEWKKETPNHKSWHIKYYKGLGTSTAYEAKEYFSNLSRHRIDFSYTGQPCDESIVLAFSKTKADSRRKWLDSFQDENVRRRELGLPPVYLYKKETRRVTYCDFVNKELILFSHADNVRSIPSMVDGLKPGQRKVLYTCFRRKNNSEIKVSQLSGAVSEKTSYHHGDQSLHSTIVNMAQDFVGSNNINLLLPEGQFGTRLKGGKDVSAARYISTRLNPVTRCIFPEVDDRLLNYLYEDNQMIEPEWYCPIIPMVLVNGSEGIGTGYLTKIPNYNPREVVDNIKRLINGEEPIKMLPWFKGYTGEICEVGPDKVLCTGTAYIGGSNTVVVTELPIRVWTYSYKKTVLGTLVKSDNSSQNTLIKEYLDYSSDHAVKFFIKFQPDVLDTMDDAKITSLLKLQTTLNLTQFVLFDGSGKLHRYASAEDVLKDFYNVRLNKYVERKAFLEGSLSAEIAKLDSQVRFILEKIAGDIVVENKKKLEMIDILVKANYPSDPLHAFQMKEARERAFIEEEQAQSNEAPRDTSEQDYDYLLGMPLWSLTFERKNKLIENRDERRQQLETLIKCTPQDLWLQDLENFLKALDKHEENEIKKQVESRRKNAAKKVKTPIRTRDLNCKVQCPDKIKREKVNVDVPNGTPRKTLFGKAKRSSDQDDDESIGPKKRIRKAPQKTAKDSKPKKEKNTTAKAKRELKSKIGKTKVEKKVTESSSLEEAKPQPRQRVSRSTKAKPKAYVDSFIDDSVESESDFVVEASDDDE